MHTGRSFARLALIMVMLAPLVSCAFFDELAAVRTFKDANVLYGRGDYEGAIEEYGKVLMVLETDPDNDLLKTAYFYLANSYDNLYRPGLNDPENEGYLNDAIRFYELAAEEITEPSLRTLSMQYLVAAFGPDKRNDPSSSEPILREMIQIDPGNPDNYFALAKLYEDAGLYEDAELVMLEVRNMRGDDPIVYLQLAGFYNRAGEFEQTIDALEQRAAIEPDNPEAYYTISTYYWEKAFRDFRITQEEKSQYIMAGLEAVDLAIDLNDRYVDALVYKNILLRMQANMISCEDTDDIECISFQEGLIAEADDFRDRAEELQKQQREGAAAAVGQ